VQQFDHSRKKEALFFQKSHDLDLNDQILVPSPSLKYIIQRRRPLEILKSGFQLMCARRYSADERAARGKGFLDRFGEDPRLALLSSLQFISDNALRPLDDQIYNWFARQQAFIDGFHIKWVERFLAGADPKMAILVDYEELVGGESEATLRRIEQTIDIPFARDLAEAKSLVPVTPRREAFEGETPFFTELFHQFRETLEDADQRLCARWRRHLRPS
jgi:hypothetical protein